MDVDVQRVTAAWHAHNGPEKKTEQNDHANTSPRQSSLDKGGTRVLAESAGGHLRVRHPNDHWHTSHWHLTGHTINYLLLGLRLHHWLAWILHHGLTGLLHHGLLHHWLARILHHGLTGLLHHLLTWLHHKLTSRLLLHLRVSSIDRLLWYGWIIHLLLLG